MTDAKREQMLQDVEWAIHRMTGGDVEWSKTHRGHAIDTGTRIIYRLFSGFKSGGHPRMTKDAFDQLGYDLDGIVTIKNAIPHLLNRIKELEEENAKLKEVANESRLATARL